jgi:cysteine-rich repeat protein
MLGTELRARSRWLATCGWILVLTAIVPGACGGDLLINYENEDEPSDAAGGEAGGRGEDGGAAGMGVGGDDGAGGVGGDPKPSTGGSHVGSGSGGKGGNGQGGSGGGNAGSTASGASNTSGGSGGSTTNPCGDSDIDDGEECDDGNVKNGDGCSSSCVDTSACDTCMATNCIETEGPLADLCFNMPGTSTVGTGAGRAKGELCYEMAECIHHEACWDAVEGINPCYCGSVQGASCLTPATNGPCKSEIQAALETTASDQIGNVGDTTHPSGLAYALIMCTYNLCHSECYASQW